MKKLSLYLSVLILWSSCDNNPAKKPLEIDFEYLKQKIIIPVEIDNQTYRFCLDTGSVTHISTELRDKLSPKFIDEGQLTDGNDRSQTVASFMLEKVTIGSLEFNQVEAVSHPEYGAFKCFDFDGYIGSDLLQDYILQIDLEAKKIRITKDIESLSIDLSLGQEMYLINRQKTPYVWLNFGQSSFRDLVMVDTGMHGIYDLSLETHKRLLDHKKINLIAKSTGAAITGAFGLEKEREQFLFHFPSISIGDFTLINHVNKGTHAKNSRIGAKLLEYGRMTFDFINEEFYFEPHQKKVMLEPNKLFFNITSMDEKIIVGIVWDENLKQKIQFGDEIIAVNDWDLTKTEYCDFVLGPSIFTEKSNSFSFRSQKDSVFTLEIKREKMVFGE